MKKEILLRGALIRNNQGSVIVHEEGTLIKHLCFSTVAAENAIVVECKNSSPHDLQGFCLPVGTKITITAEIPELPKEQIVLPEGMAWKGNLLFSPDGALIAGVRDDDDSGWYRVPFTVCKLIEVPTASMDEKERHKVIENALAEHGYFGVRKVVEEK